MLPFAFASVRDRAGAASDGALDEQGSAEAGALDLDARAALRTRSFWILTFSLLGFWFYFLAMLDHLVLHLTDIGVEDARRYFGSAIFVGVASKIGFGWIADRLGGRRAVLLDYGLLALSSLLVLRLDGALLWPFVLVYGFSVAARDVATPLLVDHCFGVRSLAQIYGWLMLTLLPGGTLGPAFAGLVHDRTGSYDLAFQVFAALNVVSFALLFFVRDERARISPRAASAAG
jgi:nitrate/nitrite transporter NarK